MKENKLWYAVQTDCEDDWGYGSYDYDEAVEMLMSYENYTLIAVIDKADDPVHALCIKEIRKEDLQ